MTVDILGTTYQIAIKKFEDDEVFERRSICGYCDGLKKEIAICDMSTYPGWEHDSPRTVEISQKQTMRHEIVHAFFYESGLADNSFAYDGAWAKNEEMVDWFSWQGPKIYAAWSEINALDEPISVHIDGTGIAIEADMMYFRNARGDIVSA